MSTDRRLRGIALAVTSATAFGVMPVLAKVVYEDGAEPIGVLAVRFAIAAVVLQVLARTRREARPPGRKLALLVGLGAVGYVGQSLCYFFALERISAGLTALLLYFYPALVVVLAAVVLRDRPRPLALVCVVVATLGTALTIGPVTGGQTSGVLLGLSAALVYAVYILVSSRVTGVGPFATAAWVLTASAVVMGALAVATRPQLPSSSKGWLALVGVALIGTVVAVTTFFAALATLGPSDTAVVSTVEPVVSIAVAAAVLGERLSPLQLVGGVVVLLAVGVLARTRPGQPVPV
ncbi:MAG: DMT family transporter [Frankiales bacterium]|nr:DMT family transporter [Frankiales bacterium]